MLDDEALREHLRELVATYESARRDGWSTDRLPPETLDKLQAAVVGFEMEIVSLEGKWKLGQNRPRADREGAIAALRATGDDEATTLADWMAATLADGNDQ
jgi:transcriptional regulator